MEFAGAIVVNGSVVIIQISGILGELFQVLNLKCQLLCIKNRNTCLVPFYEIPQWK